MKRIIFMMIIILLGANITGINAANNASTNKVKAQPSDSSKLIGKKYTGGSLPYEYNQICGSVLCEKNSSTDDCRFSISHVRKGKKEMLWFEYRVSRDQNGIPTWIIIDTLTLPSKLEYKEVLISDCSISGKDDPEIVVISNQFNTCTHNSIYKAWRANRKTKKFEAINPSGISCEDITCSWDE